MTNLIETRVEKRPTEGTHELSNSSELKIDRVKEDGDIVELAFATKYGGSWSMRVDDMVELIELLTEIKDAMEG